MASKEIPSKWYIENLLWITDKDNLNDTLLKLKTPQIRLHEEIERQRALGKPVRIIVLKARQMGFSTYTEGRGFYETVTHRNYNFGIVTQEDKATGNLFAMSNHFYDWLPDGNKPDGMSDEEWDKQPAHKKMNWKPQTKKSNAIEILFQTQGLRRGLNSSIKCFTATNDVGRSQRFSFLHLSEFAFWKCDKKKALGNLMSAVPQSPKTMVIIESTANGFEEFKELWDKSVANSLLGKDGFVPLFFAWFEEPSYRLRYDGHELDEEELSLKERFNIDNDQLQWRKAKIEEMGLDMFHQEFPSYPEEAFIASGGCVFDVNKVTKRMSQVSISDVDRNEVRSKYLKRGRFDYSYDGLKLTNVRWVDDPRGFITIYELPKPNYPYVIGGDTAGEGSDNFVNQVLDNTNGKQVASMSFNQNEDLYVRQTYCLGMYYNKALLGVEVNFSTFPNKELQRLKYPKLYVRESTDTYSLQLQKKFGFKTSVQNREGIISTLIEIARDHIELINDYETLSEMTTFIRDENYKAVAVRGKHDDRVMALAIAYAVRGQQDYKPKFNSENREMNWLEDMIYRNNHKGAEANKW